MKTSHIEWQLDPEHKCLFTKFFGTVNKTSAFKHMNEARQDPQFENDFSVLTDISCCTIQMTTDEIREISVYMSKQWPTDKALKTGVIVGSVLGHGLARVYSAFSDNRTLETLVLQHDDANLAQQLRHHFNLPDTYKFPEFMDIKS